MFEIFMTLAFISPFVYYIYHKNEVSKITSEFEEGLIGLEAIHKIKRATKKEIKKYKKEIDTMKNLGIEKGPSGRKFDDYLESIEEQNEITDLTEEELKNVFEIVSTELDDESIAEMDGESYTFEEVLEKYNEEGKGFKEVLHDFASASDGEFHEDGDVIEPIYSVYDDDKGWVDVHEEETAVEQTDRDITEEDEKEAIPDYQHDPIQTFDEMNLSDTLLRGIYNYGFEKPSIIQQTAIRPLIDGHDVIGQAQSGTGKTATFSIGMLSNVNVDEPKVVVGFAKLAFVIPALPDKFAFAKPVAFIVTVLSVITACIPEPPANVSVSAVL